MSIIRLEKLLRSGQGGRLEKIVRSAQDMQDLTAALQAVLAPDMGEALVSANPRDDELVLVVSSSAWASRLRYESDSLLRAARELGIKAERVSVRVARQA